jgi:large repetitive protein
VTFTATVTPAANGEMRGRVYFSDGGVLLGSEPVRGRRSAFRTSSLRNGTHSILATYGGNAEFLPSISMPLEQTIGP